MTLVGLNFGKYLNLSSCNFFRKTFIFRSVSVSIFFLLISLSPLRKNQKNFQNGINMKSRGVSMTNFFLELPHSLENQINLRLSSFTRPIFLLHQFLLLFHDNEETFLYCIVYIIHIYIHIYVCMCVPIVKIFYHSCGHFKIRQLYQYFHSSLHSIA